ncbi:MAG: hypothetical protein JW751_29465 [Polyangiaceae bacterium]|nr:hypothetical protein [Polyangiaceae bacterium]
MTNVLLSAGLAEAVAAQDVDQLRADCQARLVDGRRAEALAACHEAVRRRGNAQDLRVLVGALVSRDGPLTGPELSLAHALGSRAIGSDPDEPWGHAAHCDIAHVLGDGAMLKSCVADLERVAPAHPETLRAQHLAARASPVPMRALGWGALVLSLLVTGCHWVVGFFRRHGHGARASGRARRGLGRGGAAPSGPLIALLLGGLAFTCARSAGAAAGAEGDPSASEGLVSRDEPELSVPTPVERDADPLAFGNFLMEATDLAEKAMREGDYAASARYFRAVVKAVPDRSVGYARLCDAYEAMGDRKTAILACRNALGHDGVTVKDYARYVRLAIGGTQSPDPALLADVEAVLQHLRAEKANEILVEQLDCEVGMRTKDDARLEHCIDVLRGLVPDDPQLVLYQWSLAAQQARFRDAEAILVQARDTNLAPSLLDEMTNATHRLRWQRTLRTSLLVGGGLGLLVLLGYLGVAVLRRRRWKSVPIAAPAVPAVSAP